MSNNQRQVTISSDERPVSIINKTGQTVVLGKVVVDNYGGENIRKYTFIPTDDNPYADKRKKEAGYQIGIGTVALEFINPEDMLRPVLDLGYEIVDQYGTYGGTELVTVFKLPRNFHDPLGYDADLWEGRDAESSRIYPAIIVETSILAGRMAARYRKGLYRTLCSNSMVSRVMDLGELAYRHNNFDDTELLEELETGFGDFEDGLPWGPVLCTIADLRKAYQLLVDFRNRDKNDIAAVQRFKLLGALVTVFKPTVLKQKWLLDEYINHLGALAYKSNDWLPHGLDTAVHALDLLNAFTSAVNSHRSKGGAAADRGAWMAFSIAEPMITATATLANLAGAFNMPDKGRVIFAKPASEESDEAPKKRGRKPKASELNVTENEDGSHTVSAAQHTFDPNDIQTTFPSTVAMYAAVDGSNIPVDLEILDENGVDLMRDDNLLGQDDVDVTEGEVNLGEDLLTDQAIDDFLNS